MASRPAATLTGNLYHICQQDILTASPNCIPNTKQHCENSTYHMAVQLSIKIAFRMNHFRHTGSNRVVLSLLIGSSCSTMRLRATETNAKRFRCVRTSSTFGQQEARRVADCIEHVSKRACVVHLNWCLQSPKGKSPS
jgi:hypothetical protein